MQFIGTQTPQHPDSKGGFSKAIRAVDIGFNDSKKNVTQSTSPMKKRLQVSVDSEFNMEARKSFMVDHVDHDGCMSDDECSDKTIKKSEISTKDLREQFNNISNNNEYINGETPSIKRSLKKPKAQENKIENIGFFGKKIKKQGTYIGNMI